MSTKRTIRLARGLKLPLLLAALAWISAPARTTSASFTILYVKSDASGLNNGTSWENAYVGLQSALNAAALGGYQIWVAAGTYRPFGLPPSASDSFQLHNNVAIYGGFAGTETLLSQRNWETNVTTLNGYYLFFGNQYHAYHVVFAGTGIDTTAVLDGFTVTGGNAAGTSFEADGGGILIVAGSPTVSNVIFTGNYAANFGGGMMNSTSSSPMLNHVTFTNNAAGNFGGAMFNDFSSPDVLNATFSGNAANFGGAMYSQSSSSPTLLNVSFTGNTAHAGGGMSNANSSPSLVGVFFTNNLATAGSGGGMDNWSSSPRLTNVTFTGNSAADQGGGMHNSTSSSPTLANVVFSGNSALLGGGMGNYGSSPTLTNVTFSGNSVSTHGAGIVNISSSNPTILNSVLWGNTPVIAEQISNMSSSPAITYSDIQGEYVYVGTGNLNSDPKFIRNPSPGGDAIWDTGDDDYGDLRLGFGSPAIDTGSNAAVPLTVNYDRDGHPRIIGGAVDMGAYEAFLKVLLPLMRK